MLIKCDTMARTKALMRNFYYKNMNARQFAVKSSLPLTFRETHRETEGVFGHIMFTSNFCKSLAIASTRAIMHKTRTP